MYFYLADSLAKIQRPAEALPFYDRLMKEFERSEYLAEAIKRSEALKAQLAKATASRARASSYSRGRVGRLDGVVRFDDGATGEATGRSSAHRGWQIGLGAPVSTWLKRR